MTCAVRKYVTSENLCKSVIQTSQRKQPYGVGVVGS